MPRNPTYDWSAWLDPSRDQPVELILGQHLPSDFNLASFRQQVYNQARKMGVNVSTRMSKSGQAMYLTSVAPVLYDHLLDGQVHRLPRSFEPTLGRNEVYRQILSLGARRKRKIHVDFDKQGLGTLIVYAPVAGVTPREPNPFGRPAMREIMPASTLEAVRDGEINIAELDLTPVEESVVLEALGWPTAAGPAVPQKAPVAQPAVEEPVEPQDRPEDGPPPPRTQPVAPWAAPIGQRSWASL